MAKESLLTQKQKERIIDAELNPEIRKHNNFLVKNKLASWLGNIDDALFIVNNFPGRALYKELNPEQVNKLFDLLITMIQIVDNDYVIEKNALIDNEKLLELWHCLNIKSESTKNPKKASPKDTEDYFEQLLILESKFKILDRLIKNANQKPEYLEYKNNRLVEAEFKRFSEAIENNPSDTYSLLNRADILFRLGKYEKAIADYKNILKINPSIDKAWFSLGKAFLELGKYDEAIQAFDNAIEKNSDFLEPLYYKFLAFLKMNECEKAHECLSELSGRYTNDAIVGLCDANKSLNYLTAAFRLAEPPDDLYNARITNNQHLGAA
jgi:tetratricopeptide (TPR) repeat protein